LSNVYSIKSGEAFSPVNYRFFGREGFPEQMRCDGYSAVFDTDFRTWLKYEKIVLSDRVSDNEKVELALKFCFKSYDEQIDIKYLTQGAYWFYSKDFINNEHIFDDPGLINQKQQYELNFKNKGKKVSFDFFWDAQTLWGSFIATYGLDLFKADLHWWAFLEMVNHLPDNCCFNNLRRLREAKRADVPEAQRSDLNIRQYLVSIPKTRIF